MFGVHDRNASADDIHVDASDLLNGKRIYHRRVYFRQQQHPRHGKGMQVFSHDKPVTLILSVHGAVYVGASLIKSKCSTSGLGSSMQQSAEWLNRQVGHLSVSPLEPR